MTARAAAVAKPRTLIIVLGDQLSLDCVLPDDYDRDRDCLWMAESGAEARRVWSHKARIALFLAAMRHFRAELTRAGHRLIYRQSPGLGIAELLRGDLEALKPEAVRLVRPGDWDLLDELRAVLDDAGTRWALIEDPHFLTTPDRFARWAQGRKTLRMEFFYRELRRQEQILLDDSGAPLGGRWNFDASNRKSFGRSGPVDLPRPLQFSPDAVTREVLAEVADTYCDHPGDLSHFDWPVTRAQALQALDDFINHRLPNFGDYQDAIWLGETWLYHSRLSAALNLHLLNPCEVITAAAQALTAGAAPLAAVEGFIRQILGWREYVRGIYWLRMPRWREDNHFEAQQPLPDFYWTGQTDMTCLRDALRSTLEHGYAHHIQRLMVTGLFSLLLGVRPWEIEAWYHAIYVDAVSWVELPNTLGMSQFVDGGVLASKPYLASGAYIQRMSNACANCAYDPKQRHGEGACPITVLYWDFLAQHQPVLSRQPRLNMQLRNLQRMPSTELQAIQADAATLRQKLQRQD